MTQNRKDVSSQVSKRNSGDTILIFSSSFNIKLNMTPQNSKTASGFSKVPPNTQVSFFSLDMWRPYKCYAFLVFHYSVSSHEHNVSTCLTASNTFSFVVVTDGFNHHVMFPSSAIFTIFSSASLAKNGLGNLSKSFSE